MELQMLDVTVVVLGDLFRLGRVYAYSKGEYSC